MRIRLLIAKILKIFPHSGDYLLLLIVVQLSLSVIGVSLALASPKVDTPKIKDKELTSLNEFVPNELLIKINKDYRKQIKENPSDTGVESLDKKLKIKPKKFKKIGKPSGRSNVEDELFAWYTIEFDVAKLGLIEIIDGVITYPEVEELKESLLNDPSIAAVEQNYMITPDATPNDPYYSTSGSWGQAFDDLWGLKLINSENAWDITTGDNNIIVSVNDSGVDRNHPDLSGNMWVNSDEIPSNGIDDDSNGFIDDYHGWDFYNNDNDPIDDGGHGTHVAGTVGATGNNSVGITGVTQNVKIMALKWLPGSGSAPITTAIQAMQYSTDNGATISQNSWGCVCPDSQILRDAVEYQISNGIIVVTSAGNSSVDSLGHLPAAADGVVNVGASDSNDIIASFSNYGQKIDVMAPGVEILSLKNAGTTNCSVAVATNYCVKNGTSMASPHVAGLIALMLSYNPSLTNEQVRQILRTSAVDVGSAGHDFYYGYGRINASAALAASSSPTVLTPYISIPSYSLIAGSTYQINGSADGPSFNNYTLEIGNGRNPASWTLINSSSTPVTEGVLGTINTSSFSTSRYTIRLRTYDGSSKLYEIKAYDVEIDSTPPSVALTAPANNAVVQGTINLSATNSDNKAVSRVDFLIDGGVVATKNSPASTTTALWDSSTVSQGTHTLTAIAYDSSGNSTQSSSRTITVSDTEAPTIPANLRSTASGAASITLAWDASTDDVGVTGYKVYKSGTEIADVAGLTYTDSGLSPSTSYDYTVLAYDAAANESAQSSTLSTSTTPDTTAPGTPNNLRSSSSTATSITLAWDASTDDVGVTGYKVYKSGTEIADVAGLTYTDSGLSPSTSYDYTVLAYDAAANESAQSSTLSTSTTPDTTAPGTPNNLRSSSSTATSITLAWDASTDDVGVTGYKVYKSGTEIADVAGLTYTDSGLSPSTSYDYTVLAYDAAANESAQSSTLSTSTTPDTTAPGTPNNLRSSSSTATSITLAWDASTDDVGVTGYKVYKSGTEIADVAGLTYTDSGLSPSTSYDYTVLAYDAAANESAQSSTLSTSTVADTVKPSAAISAPSSSSNLSKTITISATGSDNHQLESIKLYINNVLKHTSNSGSLTYSWDTTKMNDGSYNIEAVSKDVSGNTKSHTISVVVKNSKKGDVNSDGRIDIFDLSLLLVRWNTANAEVDINNDGKVNIFDLSIMLSVFGK